jgi:hypothetical protein
MVAMIRAFTILVAPLIFLLCWLLVTTVLLEHRDYDISVLGDGSAHVSMLVTCVIAAATSAVAIVATVLSIMAGANASKALRRAWLASVVALIGGSLLLVLSTIAFWSELAAYGNRPL